MQDFMPRYDNGKRGRSKVFHIETLRRVPYFYQKETWQAIGTTTHEGRLFPQALSDAFGKIACVEEIHLCLYQKKELFETSENDEDIMLYITVYTKNEGIETFTLNLNDLKQHHRSGWNSFRAAATAEELARLFCMRRGLQWV